MDYLLPLLVLIGFWAEFSSATPCAPVRDSMDPNFVTSFDKYKASEAVCGVTSDALPFILKAPTSVAPKGTIVLIHGLSANPSHFKQMASILRGQGYNVVAPILTGHGGSDEMLSESDLNQWKADVTYAGDIAEKMGKPVFLVGHSTGGVLATLEAARAPDRYQGLIGFDPALNISKRAGRINQACRGSKYFRYENQLIPSLISWGPFHFNQLKYVADVEKITKAVVAKKCGADFVVPPYNPHYTLKGVCNLTLAVDEAKQIDPTKLPPALMILSNDSEHYGPHVSKEKLKAFLRKIPDRAIYQTSDTIHGLMIARCSPNFDGVMEHLATWMDEHRPRSPAPSVNQTSEAGS